MEAEPPPFIELPSDQAESGWIHVDGAAAIPLAVANGQGARGSMQIVPLEGKRLGDVQAAPVEDGRRARLRMPVGARGEGTRRSAQALPE
jgi:hypothetical protein